MKPFEPLEARQLLAGDVTVAWVVGGSYGQLSIVGDGADNQVEISTTAAGEIVVTGVGDTTVNGSASFTMADAGSLRWIYADLGGGDDVLVGQSWLSDAVGSQVISVAVNGGTGDDRVEFRDAPLTANAIFHLYGATGDDAFLISDLACRNVNIDLGSDANSVVLSGLTLDIVNINASTAISATSQKDHVEWLGLKFRGYISNNSTVSLGFGDDEFLIRGATVNDSYNGLYVDMGEGNDWMIFDGHSRWAGDLLYTGGSGNDDFSMANATIQTFRSEDGFGHDRWYFYQSRIGGIDIVTDELRPSPGREVFWMVDCELAGVQPDSGAGASVALGDGDDTVYISSTRAYSETFSRILVSGGNGNDQFGFNNVTGPWLEIYSRSGGGDDQVSFAGCLILNILQEDLSGSNTFSMYQTDVIDSFSINGGYDPYSPNGPQTDTVWIHSSGVWGNYVASTSINLGISATATPSSMTVYNSVFRGYTQISTGSDDNTFTAENTTFKGTTFSLNVRGGDDTLRLINNSFEVTSEFLIDGGSGTNTLTSRDNRVRGNGLPFNSVNFQILN